MWNYTEGRLHRTKSQFARLIQQLFSVLLSVLFVASPVLAADDTSAGASPPAGMTELAQKGVSLKLDVFTPTNGVATNISELTRPNDYAKTINNLHMLRRGVWSTRGTGWTKHFNTQYNSGAAVLEVLPYTSTANAAKLLFRCGSIYYDYDIATHTATSIGTGFTATDVPSMKVYGKPNGTTTIEAYFADGQHELQKWTGTGSMATSAYWPVTVTGRTFTKPKFLEEFSGRQAFAGFTAYPNSIVLSNFQSFEIVNNATPPTAVDGGWIDVPSSLGPITSLKTIRLNDTDTVLLVGCTDGVCMLVGTSADNFQVREITREFGIVSHRSFVELQNDVYFMATDGIRKFSTVSQAGLLNSRKSYLIQDICNTINRAAWAKTFAFYNPKTQEAQWWFPSGAATTPATAIVANFNTADATQTEEFSTRPIWSTQDGISPTCARTLSGTIWSGTTNGYLMNMYSGDDYDGTPIAWQYVSPLIAMNGPAQSGSLRKVVILTDGQDQKFTGEAYVLATMSTNVTKLIAADSKAFNVASSSVPDLSTWATSTTTSYPKLIDFESKGSGRFWQFRIKGTTTGDHIDLAGLQAILTVGGLSQ